LYPTGLYNPALLRDTPNKTVDQGTAATYNFTVRNNGNNPDTISLWATSNQSWYVDFSTADPEVAPGASVTVTATIYVPANSAPGTQDMTTISGGSLRNSSIVRTLSIKTTVSDQVFAAGIDMDEASLSGWPGTTLTFELEVVNEGNNHDAVDLAVSNPPVGWTALLSSTHLTLDAGQGAAVSLAVGVPTSLAGSLAWSPSVTATLGNGATVVATVEASVVLPDLELSDADIVADSTSVRAGQVVAVHVTVRNVGATVPLETVVKLSDGVSVQSVAVSMGANGVSVASFQWRVAADHGQLTATLDATQAVPEDDEGNNHASLSLQVNAPPVAVAQTPTVDGRAGESVTLSAMGSSDADGTVAAYSFDFGDGTATGWIATDQASHTYLSAGTFFAKVWVRDNSGIESEASGFVVTIAPGASTTGGGQVAAGGAGMEMTAALLGVVVGAGAGIGALLVAGRKKSGP
jgi:hypothetical protein